MSSDSELITCLIRFLMEGSLTDYQWHDLRESALHTLEELVKVTPHLLELHQEIKLALDFLRAQIDHKIKEEPLLPFNELLQREVELTSKVYDA